MTFNQYLSSLSKSGANNLLFNDSTIRLGNINGISTFFSWEGVPNEGLLKPTTSGIGRGITFTVTWNEQYMAFQLFTTEDIPRLVAVTLYNNVSVLYLTTPLNPNSGFIPRLISADVGMVYRLESVILTETSGSFGSVYYPEVTTVADLPNRIALIDQNQYPELNYSTIISYIDVNPAITASYCNSGTNVLNNLCTTFCNESTGENKCTSFETVCSRDNNITTDTCMSYCESNPLWCYTFLSTYCPNRIIELNAEGTDIYTFLNTEAGSKLCSCNLSQSFYNNIISGINNSFTIVSNEDTASCWFPLCLNNGIVGSTLASRGNCPPRAACLDMMTSKADGSSPVFTVANGPMCMSRVNNSGGDTDTDGTGSTGSIPSAPPTPLIASSAPPPKNDGKNVRYVGIFTVSLIGLIILALVIGAIYTRNQKHTIKEDDKRSHKHVRRLKSSNIGRLS